MKLPAFHFFNGKPSRETGPGSAAAHPTSGGEVAGDPWEGQPSLHCRWCGQEHAPVNLGRGQRALCVRCNSVLARKSWMGTDAVAAFTLTGLILAVPSALLPFATFSKFGNQHISFLFSGVLALWHNGMRLLAVWTAICGVVAPIVLLGILAAHSLPRHLGWRSGNQSKLLRAAHALEHWAMPEVHILAVLVSFVKLGSLVDVAVGPGLWCYGAMAMVTLLAWRSFELEPTRETNAPPIAGETT